jgi:hypothetical protein
MAAFSHDTTSYAYHMRAGHLEMIMKRFLRNAKRSQDFFRCPEAMVLLTRTGQLQCEVTTRDPHRRKLFPGKKEIEN